MAVVLLQEFAGVPPEFITKVHEELDPEGNPPEGLIVHTAVEMNGQVRVVDVWESRESFERFEEQRLRPAIGAVAQRENVEPQPPTTELVDAFDFVRGAS